MRGVKLALKIARTEPFAGNLDLEDRDPLLDSGLHEKSDEELAELVRKRVETLYHPACTCRMAPLEDNGASIFPEIVAGHTVSLYQSHL